MKFICTFMLTFCWYQGISQTSLQKIGLQHGSFDVGFAHYTINDSSRTYQRVFDWNNKVLARPIPVSIWYPSESSSLEPLTILDYMIILKEEEEWEYLPDEQILNWFYYPNTKENQKHLKEYTAAKLDAEPLNGKFPVIVYAPSYQASSIENFALCEYLASHGYVVISSPSRGTENRYLNGGTLKDVETQARDIEFLIQEVTKFSNANIQRLATMGFSFGGMSNVLAQMKNEHIDAVISLDGSVKYQLSTLKKSGYYDLSKMDVPFIHMSQKDIPMDVMIQDNIDTTLNNHFEFFDHLKLNQAYSLKFGDLTHTHFSTLGVLFQPRDSRQDRPDHLIMQSYNRMAFYTLQFSNAYLKNDPQAKSFLDQPESENKNKITIRRNDPSTKIFQFEDFNELAILENYTNLADLHRRILISQPELELPEGRLNNLGLQLVFNPQKSAAGIQVLTFATQLYPQSANLFDSLAEAHLFTGNINLAIENFEKSLELDPTNNNAKNRLTLLSKKR